jgi:hypothetical protein
MNIPEIQDELLRLEYPFLMPDHDPDIERYYYLRSRGQSKDALYLFQNRLKPRYPNDEFRTMLLRSYRSRDPAFRQLLTVGYRALGAQALDRIKRSIAYIAEKAESYNPRDVYSTIKAAEEILLLLPKERYEAVEGIDRFFRYAQALNFYVKSISKAVDLVRSYLNQSLTVVEEVISRRKEQQRRELERERQRLVKADWESYSWQKKYGFNGPLIDFSSVVFSPVDLARIEIPRNLSRIEDQTLAYCIKYWNLINDAAFERILFLYSRKFGAKNYDVYLTIRRGRLTKQRDDEILASVMSSLVTGYYYSIRGDKYLQQRWNSIKLSLQQAPIPKPPLALPPPKPAASTTVLLLPAPQPAVKPRQKAADKKPAEPAAKAVKKAGTKEKKAQKKLSRNPPLKTLLRTDKPAPSTPKKPPKSPVSSPFNKELNKKINRKKNPEQRMDKQAIKEKNVKQESLVLKGAMKTPSAKEQKPVPISFPNRKESGSVSDRLKGLSGRSYDVYQDRFFTHARSAIRKVLGAGKGLFFTIPEKAEDLVYNFFKDHYADPYMNWAESAEKITLEELGFQLESLDPIIDECYKML